MIEPNVIAPPPADAALLREVAHDVEYEGDTWRDIDEPARQECHLTAARLRALAAEREAFAKHDWNRLLGRFREAIVIGTRWQEIEAENEIRAALGIPLIEPNTQARGDR